MHQDRFDAIVKTVSAAGTRRGLLRLGALLLPGGLATLVGAESVSGNGACVGCGRRGHNPGKHKHHRKGKHKHHRKGKHKHKPSHDTPCLPPTADLQAAIYAAQPGTTLLLCAGTWTVRSTILIDRSLELAGVGNGATVLSGLDPATQARTQVLGIRPGIKVTLQHLTITNGQAYEGGGIFNQGNLQTFEVAVVRNGARWGGGIYNQGVLNLVGGTIDQNETNYAPRYPGKPGDDGGGIFNTYYGTVSVRGTRITRNSAYRGGGIASSGGNLMLERGTKVTQNRAYSGGGIWNEGPGGIGGKVILDNDDIVTGNANYNCVPLSIPNCKG